MRDPVLQYVQDPFVVVKACVKCCQHVPFDALDHRQGPPNRQKLHPIAVGNCWQLVHTLF